MVCHDQTKQWILLSPPPPTHGRHKRVSSSSSQCSISFWPVVNLTSVTPAAALPVRLWNSAICNWKGPLWGDNGRGAVAAEEEVSWWRSSADCGVPTADLAQASWLWCAPSMRIIGKAVPDQRNCRRSTHSTHAVVFAHLPFMRPLILIPPPRKLRRDNMLNLFCKLSARANTNLVRVRNLPLHTHARMGSFYNSFYLKP